MEGEISLKEVIKEYREIYLAYRNFAPRTRVEYVNDIEDLIDYLDGMGVRRVGEVTLPHLVRYIAELEKRGYAGSTRKRKVISIRSFFSYLHMEGYIPTDIGKRLIPPFVEARKPRLLTSKEQNNLLRCAKINKRDYAIIQLLLHTGMKLSELVQLTLDDLQRTDLVDQKGHEIEYIRIAGNQRNKGRVVPLKWQVSQAIRDYLAVREKSVSDNLFLNRNSQQLGERGVEKITGKYLVAAGINNASVNSLRHTFGAHLIQRGLDIKTVQALMGHRNIKTARINLWVS